MAVDQGLTPLFTTQFSANLELLLQQKGSKLRSHVSTGSHVGKMASPINQIAPQAARQPEGRYAPLGHAGQNFVRRWVFPITYDLPQLVDSFDELQTIVDPKSAYVENAANAMGRAMDDTILASVFGTNYIGQDAASLTQESFDTTKYQVAVNFKAGAATGLTVAKIIEIKRLFRKNHVDIDTDAITLVIGSQQEADLLGQQQVVSKDYNDTPVLVEGKIKRFLGCNIEVMERVPETTAGTTRGILAFVKSGVYLGMWKDMTNNVTQRTDLSGQPWQVYTAAMFGATRTMPGKVLRVLCADTSGGDITP